MSKKNRIYRIRKRGTEEYSTRKSYYDGLSKQGQAVYVKEKSLLDTLKKYNQYEVEVVIYEEVKAVPAGIFQAPENTCKNLQER